MKTKIFASFSIVLFAVKVVGQGTINFANLVVVDGARIVDAPVRYFDGTLLSGSAFVAELIAGPNRNSLSPVGLPTPFLAGADAGYFSGGIRMIDSILPGAFAFVEIRAWDVSTGSTYDSALIKGWTELSVRTGGFAGGPPANLIGMQPFCISGLFPCVPEPSTLALLFLGALILAARLRRR